MRKLPILLLILMLVTGCQNATQAVIPSPTALLEPSSVPTASQIPTVPSSPTLRPTASATATPEPSDTATITPGSTVIPSSTTAVEPSAAATVLATETPTASATLSATVTAAVPTPYGVSALEINGPLDVGAQAAALLPENQGDLDLAAAWNRYTVNATVDPEARTIQGQLQLEYTNRDSVSLSQIYFHLYPNLKDFSGILEVSELEVMSQPVEVAYESDHYLLRVDLPQPLAPGTETVINMQFSTKVPQNAAERAYGAFNKQGGLLALADALPIVAMVHDGTWDIAIPDNKGDFVNSETSLYDVTLAAPADWQLITTGVTINGQLDGGQQLARIVSGPQRDFTITLAQYAVLSAQAGGTKVNSYYRAGAEQGGQMALDVAVNAVNTFNKRYGLYPLTELDVVAIDARQFLGVEYPGLIMIEANLYNQPAALESTVAHEVGHQWWYSIVGNDVQNAAWLDEALASYSEIVYDEEILSADAAAQTLATFRTRYQRARDNGTDTVVQKPNDEFGRNYFNIVYGKAVLFFQALRNQLGDEAFDRFLHNYYTANRYKVATGTDLLTSANDACGCDVEPLYRAWITSVTTVKIP